MKKKIIKHTKVKSKSESKSIQKSQGIRIKLSPKAQANFKKVKDFMAKKSKFVRAEEFAGKGKTIEILEIDEDPKSKFEGPVIQLKIIESKTNRERIWNMSSIRAAKAVLPLLEKGITLLHVWTTGRGMNTMYHAKAVTKS